MTDNLCPTCSYTAPTPYRGKTHTTDDTEDSTTSGKPGLRASSESASGCPWQTSGQILLGGLSSVELWENLSGWLTTSAPLIQAAGVPIESTCHCLKSKAATQWHCGVVFLILSSLYFGVVYGRIVYFLHLFAKFQIFLLKLSSYCLLAAV